MGLYEQIRRQEAKEEARRAKRRKTPAPEPEKPTRGYGGRRIAGEAHLTLTAAKPWEALGMSRRTWYRRRKAGKLVDAGAPIAAAPVTGHTMND